MAKLRPYFKVALLGAIAATLMATALTGLVLDIVLVAVAIGLIFLFCKL